MNGPTAAAAHIFSIGDVREQLVVQDLRRTQIVQYAGASGDFNPLHTDEVYAVTSAGRPSVLAHGMLTMGLAGRVLTDWFGDGRLTRFGVRFVKPVWPGDTLTVTARITDLTASSDTTRAGGGSLAEITLTTVNQDGVTVLTGSASVRLEDQRAGKDATNQDQPPTKEHR